MTLVFVYGSLKTGQFNNVLLGDSYYIGKFATKENGFFMLALGSFPAVYRVLPEMDESYRYQVNGEVYDVDDIVLADLDQLEGNGYFYERELVELVGLNEPAWMYICKYFPSSISTNGVEHENGVLDWNPQHRHFR